MDGIELECRTGDGSSLQIEPCNSIAKINVCVTLECSTHDVLLDKQQAVEMRDWLTKWIENDPLQS